MNYGILLTLDTVDSLTVGATQGLILVLSDCSVIGGSRSLLRFHSLLSADVLLVLSVLVTEVTFTVNSLL